jgi:hypothetical protein
VACKMYPLTASYGFCGVTISTTPVSKVQTQLPLFLIETVSVKNGHHVLEEVETETERIIGSFRLKEYDALKTVNLPNGDRLNHEGRRND